MAESNLPAVPPADARRSATPEGHERPAGGGGGSGPPRGEGLLHRVAPPLLFVVAGLGIAVAAAAALGPPVRRAAMVSTDTEAPVSGPAFADDPAEAAAFFEARDSVVVRVPRDMTVGEFLALYHLENNPSARRALERELGAVDDADPLREGDEVTVELTLPREGVP